MSLPTERPMATNNNYVARFFGGPPLSVIFRLVLLSILIGVILEVLGLDPWNIIDSLRDAGGAHLGHGLRCGALALALSPARRRRGRADLADRAAHAHVQRTVTAAGGCAIHASHNDVDPAQAA